MTVLFRDPDRDCSLCPRLVNLRQELRQQFDGWHNGPVPAFGPLEARLLIVGLAPGLKGANRTGRPFTGDWAGDLLYQTLSKFGYSTGCYDARPDDGLNLLHCRITNAVRCLPPENKPNGAEVAACRPFLVDEMAAMPNLRTVLALGAVSHGAVLAALGQKKSAFKFSHNATHEVGGSNDNYLLVDSYHSSRYNTNTGRLTAAMFEAVFETIAAAS